MKIKILTFSAAAMLLIGGGIFAYSQKDCPLKGTAFCPKTSDCPLADSPDCPLLTANAEKASCCKKK